MPSEAHKRVVCTYSRFVLQHVVNLKFMGLLMLGFAVVMIVAKCPSQDRKAHNCCNSSHTAGIRAEYQSQVDKCKTWVLQSAIWELIRANHRILALVRHPSPPVLP
jgi:hypothetical protein